MTPGSLSASKQYLLALEPPGGEPEEQAGEDAGGEEDYADVGPVLVQVAGEYLFQCQGDVYYGDGGHDPVQLYAGDEGDEGGHDDYHLQGAGVGLAFLEALGEYGQGQQERGEDAADGDDHQQGGQGFCDGE